jgi:hypothetical protein
LPRENPILFYTRRWFGQIAANWRFAVRFLRLVWTGQRIMRHPRLFDYMDEALAPVDERQDADRETALQVETGPVEVTHRSDAEDVASVSVA